MKRTFTLALLCLPITSYCQQPALVKNAKKGPAPATSSMDVKQDPAAASGSTPDVGDLDLDHLLKIEVTTASKKAQSLDEVPAAISVVTQEDIRRSGATSVMEALRLIPGVTVAELDAARYSIGIRGFAGRFADKLLVLVDGRSVYTPSFGGVYWEGLNLIMEDIDRIEVIRGPGGSLWGANAVDGIINIITKSAKDTTGNLADTNLGDKERIGVLRHGGQVGPTSYYRVSGKYQAHDAESTATGGSAPDRWDGWRGSFRYDTGEEKRGKWAVEGETYNNRYNQFSQNVLTTPPFAQTVTQPASMRGEHLLANWDKSVGTDSSVSGLFYYDRFDRENLGGAVEHRETVNLDIQHRLAPSSNTSLIYGLGYRRTWDGFAPGNQDLVVPRHFTLQTFSGFVQDEITASKSLKFTIGTKIERNDYTRFEVQPSARLLWKVDKRQSAWASVARAVRTPTRVEEGANITYQMITLPNGAPALVKILGNPNIKSEVEMAYEFGYRNQVSDKLTLDAATFFNHYERAGTLDPSAPFLDPTSPIPVIVPQYYNTDSKAETYGFELSAKWQPAPRWRLTMNYSYLGDWLSKRPGTTALNSPHHQGQLVSNLDLKHNLEFDSVLYLVSKIDDQNVAPYARLDLRLGWKPKKDLILSIGVKNLLTERHAESTEAIFQPDALIDRTVYGSASWKF